MTAASPKFLISGYYGHNNFGDEAILSVIVAQLKKEFEEPQITVISNKPKDTSSAYQVDSIYKYDFLAIIKAMSRCDMFISGGGSLFQDVTSIKSLVYYLLLPFMAKILGKKVFIFAQGIGPLNSAFARVLTSLILKLTDGITVRDNDSEKLLSTLGVRSTVTADPVWMFDYLPQKPENDVLKVGIQLRNWKFQDDSALSQLADAVIANFNGIPTQIELISLQTPQDNSIMDRFHGLLKEKGFKYDVNLRSGMDLRDTAGCIAGLDLMIAMRYHAGLVAAKYCVPTLLLSYDPKVSSLAQETKLPCIPVNEMGFESLNEGIKDLIMRKDLISAELQPISRQNYEKARETLLNLKRAL